MTFIEIVQKATLGPVFFTGISRLAAISLVALIGLSVSAHAEPKTKLEASDDGEIEFPVDDTLKGEKIIGTGDLEFPDDVKGKVPAVILAHGTRGVGYREETWADFLNDQGYATFVIDYFSPRGEDGRGRYVPRPPEDVWGALNILATHPRIDKDRFAVMGFSNGGSVTRSAAELDPTKDTNGILPKAYIMLYGGCHSGIYPHSPEYQPALLYIVGSKDTLVTADTCLFRQDDQQVKVKEVMVIEGAYHMFDGDTDRTIHHRKWGTIELRSDHGATEKARAKVSELLKRVF